MWRQADHPAIREVPALGFTAVLGNSVVTCFGRAASLIFRHYIIWACRDITHDVTVPHVHQSRDLLL